MVKMPKVVRFVLAASKENDNVSSLRKSRLDSSSLARAIHNKGALRNSFVSFDAIVKKTFSSMGCCVG